MSTATSTINAAAAAAAALLLAHSANAAAAAFLPPSLHRTSTHNQAPAKGATNKTPPPPPAVFAVAPTSTNGESSESESSFSLSSDAFLSNQPDFYEDVDFQCEPHELWAVERVDRVSDWSSSVATTNADGTAGTTFPNPLSLKSNVPPSWFVDDGDAVAAKVQVDARETDVDHELGLRPEAFALAGPRADLAFDPAATRAAIVTCGGICPGLNTVVREVVMCLRRQYGVREVYGVPGGYRGFRDPDAWMELDEAAVANLHNVGGTVLGTSRGGHDTDAIVDSLAERGIDVLFVVGGDGTVRGAERVCAEIKRRGLPIAVAVVPKTIDNDIPLLDKPCGFDTAVDAASKAIGVANVEAEGFPYGLGVVKVMGRNSGFIAMHSTLGSRVADLCLVPEVDFYLDGPGGVVDHLYDRLIQNGKAIVVVAEGAGQDLIAGEGRHRQAKDASGNVLLEDVGPWLCSELKTRLDDRLAQDGANVHGDTVSLKYVDPSYMVRGIPPNTADNVLCTQLAHDAVHGAMAGMSNFLVGSVNTRPCYVPIGLVAHKRNVVDTAHRSLWEYVVFDTAQPSFGARDDDGRDESEVLVSASGGVILSDAAANGSS